MLMFNAKSHTGMNLAIAFADVLCDFGIDHKILFITCNNTSNNNTMVTELDHMLTKFSPVNCTCCFAHILNLVAKLLKQFDVKQEKKDDNDLNEDEQLLLALAENIDKEEPTVAQENDNKNGESEDNDSLEGWVDKVEALTSEEWEQLKESI